MDEQPTHTPEYDLVVLFVRGIGTQSPGETLTEWGDALLKVLSRVTSSNRSVKIKVGPARPIFFENENTGPGVIVTIENCGKEEKWLLAEASCPNSFVAPGYFDLLWWSLYALPWAISLNISQGHFNARRDKDFFKRVIGWITAILKVVLSFALCPFFIAFLLLVAILGAIPIPQLRRTILNAQGSIVSTIGDTLAFVESPVRAALIRTRLQDELKCLKSKARSTVVIAHSQGAAIVLDSLGGIRSSVFTTNAADGAEGAIPNRLITFGAGINHLASLKLLSEGRALTHNAGLSVILATIFAAVVTFWLSFSEIHAQELLKAIGINIGLISVLIVLGFAAVKVAKSAPSAKGIILMVALAAFGATAYYFDEEDLPLFSSSLLIWATVGYISSVYRILSIEPATYVANVGKPPTLDRWIDFYASDDLISNGDTLSSKNGADEAIEVYNYGSVFSDHTTYWKNTDGFVARVLAECARATGSSWASMIPVHTAYGDALAKWRIRSIQMIRFIVTCSAVVTFFVIWHKFRDSIPLIALGVPDMVVNTDGGKMIVRILELLIFVVIIVLIVRAVMHAIWGYWARGEQKAFLTRQTGNRLVDAQTYFTVLCGVLWFFMWLNVKLIINGIESFSVGGTYWSEFAIVVGGSTICANLWFRFAPKDPGKVK